MYLRNLDQIRGIEWSRNYLWDIQFPDAPAPFNSWFPATDVSVEMGNLETEKFNIFISDFSIPIRRKERTLSITFVDDVNHTLIDWITLWFDSIVLPGVLPGSGVLPLELAVKPVYIARLDSRRNYVKVGSLDYIDKYSVYPTDSIKFSGGSGESKVNSYEVEFVIAGVIQQGWIENMIAKGKVIKR